MDEFFDVFENTDMPAATNAVRPAGSWRKTFGGLFALMRDDIMECDMEWIKSVHPKTMTLEEWMRETHYDGGYQGSLKLVGFENDYGPQLREMRIIVMLDTYHEDTSGNCAIWIGHMNLPRVLVF